VRENDGQKLDHHTLEVLRLRAVEQVQAGAHPEDVAAALGLHRKTVYGWLAKFREGGRDALVAKPVPGRPPKLPGRRSPGCMRGSTVLTRRSSPSSSRCEPGTRCAR
jgi:transposase-like protein